MRRVLFHSTLSIVVAAALTAAGVCARGAEPPVGTIEIAKAATESEKLAAVLTFVFENEAQKHGWPANYKALWCPSNVFNLLRRLDQAHVDLTHARVWYILPQAAVQRTGKTTVQPKAGRAGVNQWSFHVALELEGRILDLDFTDHPEIVSVDAYAAAMWQKGPLAASADANPLFVRVIPAMDYLSSYSGNWSWYQAGGGGRYSAVDFNSLL